ncbi:amidophosphoribosyltransferase [Persicobacter sp. CCB-QB2]|uniref:amidophosphoribosyltransferase n=1 Tax=Persicobacter sp. CCB-QB2 TaxID=1561025 RepID=UPI0006A97055|nr:amidophosphoribosyltransferase [Persicobacter sp. CCB-QB2]
MSDAIKHECGIAMIRLRKPLQYYYDKYKTPSYGMSKLYLLMEKQHNRGQDGVGVANIKLDLPPGSRYISRYRSVAEKPIQEIFEKIAKKYNKAKKIDEEGYMDAQWMKENTAFTGEMWLGHLRYGTHGKNSIENCHPFLRQNNWRSRNLVVAGNFNMTNVDELFDRLVSLGQYPKEKIDTVTVMEKIGHFLDMEVQRLFDENKDKYDNQSINAIIEEQIDLQGVLQRSCKDLDGGYAMAGMTGYGGAFVARDPAGIRPAYYYADDEVIVVASEKPAIKTAFDIDYDQIKEIPAAHALIIDKDAEYKVVPFIDSLPKKSCSFERIYFSRGSDPNIYQERKDLGKLLIPQVLKAIDHDLENTVFSFIPNTAEISFLGMTEAVDNYLVEERLRAVQKYSNDVEALKKVLTFRPRIEKLVIKDAKLRTFIADDDHRDQLVAHVYDTTYEVVQKGKDTLVIIDDSIVRGTTLEKSILTLVNKLRPKKVVIVSSAPQIRFPDCYGIDMSRMKEFIAFRATLELLEESGQSQILKDVYQKIIENEQDLTKENYVKAIYEPFTDEQISKKVAEIVTPKVMESEVEVIFQTVDNLHKACPEHTGDWYFTGNYPTAGGNRVVNKAFKLFMENSEERSY